MHKTHSEHMPNEAADNVDASPRPIAKQPPATPVIENAADYVDALTRPRKPDSVMHKKSIIGRRMRDKYRIDGPVVTDVIKKVVVEKIA